MTCNQPPCGRPATHRGWCGMHYGRWRRNGYTGSPAKPRKRGPKTKTYGCAITGCDNPHHAGGWCNAHYLQQLRQKAHT